jgi:hypothetical protein
MKWLSAGLTFVNSSTVCGLLLGIVGGGLGPFSAFASLVAGCAAAGFAYFKSSDSAEDIATTDGHRKYRNIWLWIMAAIFAIFAVRSFCWLLYIDNEQLKIQSPNNLGDLALHITYIRNFANGVPMWPDNPIYVFSKMRYPAGIDLFNGLLSCLNIDLTRGLVWTGLFASLATFYAFLRWGGPFAVAGFLFNGGIIGFQFVQTLQFIDYQGSNTIAWKSIPLSMFLTQRGLLYAIPAGLLLLWHWRETFFRDRRPNGPLPFWLELSLYGTMPLFHIHTFLALSIVLVSLFVCGDRSTRRHAGKLVASALVPATFFVWLITDHFHAGSVLEWHPGWAQNVEEFKRPWFLQFWWENFGLWFPLVIGLVGICGWRLWKTRVRWGQKMSEETTFLLAAVTIFLLALLVKTAPWEWDNLKIMIWAYFLVLPFLWEMIRRWSLPVRIAVCIMLFGSGFVSLFGGLAAGREGFGFANRSELDMIAIALRKLPVEARFAAYPTYNHPLLLQGRKVALGYPGHLWTQGFKYNESYDQLTNMMKGVGNWQETARRLGVRYIFWGREEATNYPTSTTPWVATQRAVATASTWGTIYDLTEKK